MADAHIMAMVHTLLANMIGDTDRTHELRGTWKTSEIPGAFERDVWDFLMDASAKNYAPTKDNLLWYMQTQRGQKNAGVVITMINTLSEAATESRDVSDISRWLNEYMRQVRRDEAIKKAQAIMSDPTKGTPDDRYRLAINLISSEDADPDDGSSLRSGADLARFSYDEMINLRERREKGISLGPSLKFSGFVGVEENGVIKKPGLVPRLSWGESSLVSALTGVGKTTVGQVWAEFNAWHQNLKVLYVFLETPPSVMSMRSVARNALIPMDYQKAGLLNPDTPKNKVDKEYIKYLKFLETQLGSNLEYLYAPGWNVFQINNAITQARIRADATNQGLLVIIDYYQLISHSEFTGNKADQLAAVALRLRDHVKRQNELATVGVHQVVFAQENVSDSGATYTHSSKEVMHYYQLYVSIKRSEEAQDDVQIPGVEDALGNKRYWHRIGEKVAWGTLEVIKANDNSSGDVGVRFENGLYRVTD
jgi:hypothetical protein